MEKNRTNKTDKIKIDHRKLLEEKEKSINNENLYSYLLYLKFTYYINYFPKLQNESINRLSYYYGKLFKKFSRPKYKIPTFLSAEGDEKNSKDKNIVENIFSLLPSGSSSASSGNGIPKSSSLGAQFFTFNLVLATYREVVNLISARNSFTKPIEFKINLLVDSLEKSYVKCNHNSKIPTTVGLKNIRNEVNNMLKYNEYYQMLVERQKFRFNGLNMEEYKNRTDMFELFSTRDESFLIYDRMKTRNSFEYERHFFDDLPKLLDGIEIMS